MTHGIPAIIRNLSWSQNGKADLSPPQQAPHQDAWISRAHGDEVGSRNLGRRRKKGRKRLTVQLPSKYAGA